MDEGLRLDRRAMRWVGVVRDTRRARLARIRALWTSFRTRT